MNETARLKFSCPQCRKPVQRDNDFFPFCSDRCRISDLGKWATGEYRLAGEPVQIPSENEDEY